jgi:hypothetical protein
VPAAAFAKTLVRAISTAAAIIAYIALSVHFFHGETFSGAGTAGTGGVELLLLRLGSLDFKPDPFERPAPPRPAPEPGAPARSPLPPVWPLKPSVASALAWVGK